MLDDRKHTEAVKAFFTEREFIDLCRVAAREDRKPGELVRVLVRRAMYGTIGAEAGEGNGANRADGGTE
jgi:hypothetical protein